VRRLKVREQGFWGVRLLGTKLTYLILILVLMASCAKPRYVDGLEGRIDGISGECGFLFSSENICLKTEWIQKPTESTYGEMTLSFVDRNDQSRFVDPLTEPFIVLWMPSMGHGSSPVKMERLDIGKFRASEIFFIMPGPWDIRYQLKDGSNVIEEKIQKVTI
jgi:hypothetical protein